MNVLKRVAQYFRRLGKGDGTADIDSKALEFWS